MAEGKDTITASKIATRALPVGAALAALAVAMGAFGAHALESMLSESLDSTERLRLLDTWETAARYHMYHALALVAVGMIAARQNSGRLLDLAALGFLVGTTVFSGCLYAYVLSGVRILGALVPIGGVSLIAGWVLLACATLGAASRSE